MSEPLESVLAEDYLAEIETIEMDALRAKRVACTEIETGLSYLRRMAQGRLDVLAVEQSWREEGDAGTGREAGIDSLIDRLPAALAGSTRAPGVGRLPTDWGTGRIDPELADELDELVVEGNLDEPGSLTDEQLAEAVEALAAFERRVSGLRRQLFDRLDLIENELTRRYRTGEASVDSLLR